MTEPAFRSALKKGLGRVLRFAEQSANRPFPYRQALLDACVECQTFDPQIDGLLIDMTWQLVVRSGEKQLYRDHVLASLGNCGDSYDAQKRFGMAAAFADEGDREMRDAMYRYFRPGPRHGEGLGIQFVSLDGPEGFLFAARKVGAALEAQGDTWDFGWLLSRAESEFGDGEAFKLLDKAAPGDADLERFLLRARVDKVESAERPVIPGDFTGLAALATASPQTAYSQARSWARKASDSELLKAARALAAAPGSQELAWLLGAFQIRPFPLEPAPLIAWVESCPDGQLTRRVLGALEQITHQDVRALGLRRKDAGLLVRNFQPGDHARVREWIEVAKDDAEIHLLVEPAKKLVKENADRDGDAPALLIQIYESSPCMFCRQGAVKEMLARKCLPTEVAEECRYDGNDEIRELVGNPATY